jgi:[ribosomal protein S18]-alanine N-acetyltransferase
VPQSVVSQLTIRAATPGDISAMLQIEKRAVTASHWSRQQYESLFSKHPHSLALVIEDHSGIHGFLIAHAVGSEWEIENIAIAGAARRRGLGTRLMGEFIDRVRRDGGESVFLEVRESNQAARSLYEKWAFVESGRRNNYYRQPNESAVVYRLRFG